MTNNISQLTDIQQNNKQNNQSKKKQINPHTTHKQGKLLNIKRNILTSQYKKYPGIHNYLMINFEKRQVLTIEEYLKNKIDFKIQVLAIRTRIKIQLKGYKFKSKFKLNYFYQNHVIKNYQYKQIIFFAKIFFQKGSLHLNIQSISQTGIKFTVPIRVNNDNYQLFFQDFLNKHHISLNHNKAMKKIKYQKFIPQIIKIQSVFKGFTEFNYYHQYKLQHPEWCNIKCDHLHKQFISCVNQQFYITLSYECSIRQAPHTFKYRLRYTQIINEQFSSIQTVQSQKTFIDMIGRINSKIQAYQINSNQDYKKRLERLKQTLYRFLFKYKNRKLARLNYLQIKKIDIQDQKILIIARNSPKISESYEVSIYNLKRTYKSYCFTIKKDVCLKYIQSKQIQKLFYISYNHCILKPNRIKDRHYVIELKQIQLGQNVYFFQVYQQKKTCFYLQVYKSSNEKSYESIFRKEIPKRQLIEMNTNDVKKETMQIIQRMNDE